MAFVKEAIETALAESRYQTSLHKGEAGLPAVQAGLTLAETIDTALTAWEVECYETLGHLQREHARAWATLGEMAQRAQGRNPREVHGEDWRKFDQAVTDLRRVRRLIQLRDTDPTQADTWGISPEFGTADPSKRLMQIKRWATGEDEPGTKEDQEDEREKHPSVDWGAS
jgi:hypothetical protein